MKPSVLGALLGGVIGFCTVLVLNIAVVPSTFLRALLFPGNLFIRYATNKGLGDFGQMIFDTLAYASNILLYAVVGFALGKLLEGRRRPQAAAGEATDDRSA